MMIIKPNWLKSELTVKKNIELTTQTQIWNNLTIHALAFNAIFRGYTYSQGSLSTLGELAMTIPIG
tara:strand:+ start:26 stop:223 length:198 start_codon:yes stop_codon:yes gene_type:complete